MNTRAVSVAVLLTSGIVVANSRASTIYWCHKGTGIYRLDPDTGVSTNFANVAAFNMAADHAGNGIWFSELSGGLSHLDLATLGVTPTAGPILEGNALTEAPDGYLYLGGRGVPGAPLLRVDPATGQPTTVGTGASNYAGDLATSSSGVTYATTFGGLHPKSLVTVNLATGQQTLVGFLDEFIYGLAFTADGRLWGTDNNGGLWQINPITAEKKFKYHLSTIPEDLAGEIVPAPSTLIPCFCVVTMVNGRRRRSASRSR